MRTLLLVALFMLAAPAAFGAAQPGTEPTPEPMNTPKTTEIIFGEGEEVGGTRHDPGTDVETARVKLPFKSLITIRTDFRPELLQSAETL